MKHPQTCTLNLLPPGKHAVIHELDGAPDFCGHLQDIGFLPGTPVACVAVSPHSDPHAYLVRGSVMALRASDARQILIREVSAHEGD